ncbi:uncharacterized protein MAM_05617 [Metarhizium album ARSEF 1941]|uniref:Pleckstrin homology domain-containing protein n=1 Tax=Metarhizium album (strain ARSEF 1941) TaxID=1081103 RepID=A0A0B2WST0_METAS|nr:uncharacterized protein MAM_05617 [Metarhizium album ARSEF 1941]KHN96674.1 hypothetical protein MAM_05617 [Metarhizium album ARSEF 1941]
MASDRTNKRLSRDVTNDETISILDPRRFTPTLHANLVSEILALRRDQDEKTKQIENLENALHSVKEEHEQLQESFTSSSKESRSLKRQLSLLEGGSSSALVELAQERDAAVDSISETKKRLDWAQRKIRSQEDDSQRVHELWAQEKDGWEDERRKYERKLHIAESRLKMVIDEIAAFQPSTVDGTPYSALHDHESDAEESEKENDAVSVRTMSMTNSIRHSPISGPIPYPGNSLADELNFDDDQTDADGRESALSMQTSPKHIRTFSRDSVTERFHFRNQSIESLRRPASVARGRLFMNPAVLEALEGVDEEMESQAPQTTAPRVSYMDTGIQYSPPPSPSALRFRSATPVAACQLPKKSEHDTPSRADTEVEANQRKKRVQVVQPLSIGPPNYDNKMISAAAQTMEMPLSPPKTPQTPFIELQTSEKVPVLVTSSTQTEEAPEAPDVGASLPSKRAPSPPPLRIPTINIQPPTSRPTTPQEPRLPQHFKHFGCQVNLSSMLPTSDASMQTEGIQVDKRLALLPAHLQPSSISSCPISPNASKTKSDNDFTPVPPRNPKRLTNSHDQADLASSPVTSRGDDEKLRDSSLSLHDDSQAPFQRGTTRHSNRVSSIFAGFDTASSEEGDEFGDLDGSDAEFRTALSAPKPPSNSTRSTKRGSIGAATTASEQHRVRPLIRSQVKPVGTEVHGSIDLADKENRSKGLHKKLLSRAPEKPLHAPTSSSLNRTSTIRKAAIIQSGIATQKSRSRSPSHPDGKHPPFPIPNRASSRRSQIGLYSPSEGHESPTRGEMWHRRGSSSRSSYQSHSIRKVRSAAALPRAHRYRKHGSRSPPPLSPSTEAPESPGLPPLPQNDITTPRSRHDKILSSYRKHRHGLSINTDNTNNTGPTTDASSSHTISVVDAIAQTMVGEWMLKYVRRRKSFSVPENTGKDDSSNDRHRRWVWLAPYERSILWSSKQPSSGNALLGKTGRKLTIQSVLDVKDDNPAPKVMPTVFNRSILILTPQRALKFTASSVERHYLWLTALSFLAHSSQAVPEIISAPHLNTKEHRQHQHQPPPDFEAPQPKHKRGGIRDSIRLAKGRTAAKIGVPIVPSIPSAPSSRMSEATGLCGHGSSSAGFGGHSREQSGEAAEPPFIPRFSERSVHPSGTHGRKRSNTGGHVAPPLSFRGFSGPAGAGSGPQHSGQSTANESLDTTMSSEAHPSQASTNTTWNMSQTASSQRTSEASSRPSNFFDAIGTVRMEAFISPLAYSQYNEYPDEQSEYYRKSSRRRSKEIRRRNSRNRQRDSSKPCRRGRDEEAYSRGRCSEEEDYFLRDDPFKGF